MMATWGLRMPSSNWMNQQAAVKSTQSWHLSRLKTIGIGFQKICFFPFSDCVGWSALHPAATPKPSTAARWCCELKETILEQRSGLYLYQRGEITMGELNRRTIRSRLGKVCAQAANPPLRVSSLMALARLLGPIDFRLLGMLTPPTEVANVPKDFGLATVTVLEETASNPPNMKTYASSERTRRG